MNKFYVSIILSGYAVSLFSTNPPIEKRVLREAFKYEFEEIAKDARRDRSQKFNHIPGDIFNQLVQRRLSQESIKELSDLYSGRDQKYDESTRRAMLRGAANQIKDDLYTQLGKEELRYKNRNWLRRIFGL